ncbi:MAG: hypothetical protein ACE5HP_12765, partial [Gemmatimonadota bacterium]
DGLLAFHITNRHMDLEPVLGGILEELGVTGLAQSHSPSSAERQRFVFASKWVVTSRSREALERLRQRDPRWQDLDSPKRLRVWTDDYSNILRVLKWSR